MSSFEHVKDELGQYFKAHVEREEKDFLCFYGSSVYSKKEQSDVDLFVATDGAIATDALIDVVKKVHIEHDRQIDEEVPFCNKVRYSFIELMDSVNYGGFDRNGSRITVPAIQKDADFLNSQEVKLRLAFNALTTPHDVIGTNLTEYHFIRERAEEAAALLAIALNDDPVFTVDSLYNSLVVDEDGNEGEMFLGYKVEYDVVQTHLKTSIDNALDRLGRLEVVQIVQDGYYVDIDNFNPIETMRALTRRN